MRGGTIAIGLWAIITVAFAIVSRFSPKNWRWKAALPFFLLFGLILTRTVFASNCLECHFYLEKSLSLLIIPFCFAILPISFSKKDLRIFQLLFAASTLLMATIGIFMVAFYFKSNIGPAGKWPTWEALIQHPDFAYFIRTAFEDMTSFHPTYACLFLAITFCIFLNDLLEKKANAGALGLCYRAAMLLLVLAVEALLASRTPLMATFIGAAFIIAIKGNSKAGIAVLLLILAIAGWAMSHFSPSFSSRLKEVSVQNLAVPTTGHEDSFNLRRGILHCSAKIIKEHWLWGVGPGNVQNELNQCYGDFDHSVYEGRDYNTHDQYFDYWASMGILGPLLLLTLLCVAGFRAFSSGLHIGVSVVGIFAICMVTENLLLRQYGIVSFSYFLCLYSFSDIRIKA